MPAKVVQFTIPGKSYRPNIITIKENTSITSVNKIRKFALPGTSWYLCEFDPNVEGTVIVQ